MKKNVKKLLLMILILMAVGAAVATLLLFEPPAQEEPVSEPMADIELLSMDESQLKLITITAGGGDSLIVPYTGYDGEAAYTLDAYQEYKLSSATLAADVRAAIALTSSRNLGNVGNLEEFGLYGDGLVKVAINSIEGNVEYIVGIEAGGTSGRYVLMDGEVHIVPNFPANFLSMPFVYFDKEIYSVEGLASEKGEQEEEIPENILHSVTIKNAKMDYREISIIRNESAQSQYLMTEPVLAVSGTAEFLSIADSIGSLLASSVVDVGITPEKLAEYGLDEPYAELELSMNEEDHSLKISAPDAEGSCYIIADDNDIIYAVPLSSVSAWAQAEVMDLRVDYIWQADIYDVGKLTVRTYDEVRTYIATRQEVEEAEDDQSYDLSIKRENGESIEYVAYRDLYQQLTSIPVMSITAEEHEDSAALEITYDYTDGSQDVVSFYKCTQSDRYAAFLSGQFNGIVRASSVDEIFNSLL